MSIAFRITRLSTVAIPSFSSSFAEDIILSSKWNMDSCSFRIYQFNSVQQDFQALKHPQCILIHIWPDICFEWNNKFDLNQRDTHFELSQNLSFVVFCCQCCQCCSALFSSVSFTFFLVALHILLSTLPDLIRSLIRQLRFFTYSYIVPLSLFGCSHQLQFSDMYPCAMRSVHCTH